MAIAFDEDGLVIGQRCARQLLVGLFEQNRELLFGAGLSVAAQRRFHFLP